MTRKSPQLDALYGAAADPLFDELERLDPALNAMVQELYDEAWALPPLSLREKSMITVAALIALGREAQLQTHITGFLHAGGSEDELRAIIRHLAAYSGFPSALSAMAVLDKMFKNK